MSRSWYRTPCYRWISISAGMSCIIFIITMNIVDMTLNSCNDPYHNIHTCLNSSSCDVRYCEPSICSNYTCLPRISSYCIDDEMIYYPNGECPKPKQYKSAWIVLGAGVILLVDFLVFIGSLIHDKCTQGYTTMYLDDDLADTLARNPWTRTVTCNECNGLVPDCTNCNGSGKVKTKEIYSDDF